MAWKKSSYCGASNTCVEMSWRKSSRCSNEAICTEVGTSEMSVLIRDSKFPEMEHIRLSRTQFGELLTVLKNQ